MKASLSKISVSDLHPFSLLIEAQMAVNYQIPLVYDLASPLDHNHLSSRVIKCRKRLSHLCKFCFKPLITKLGKYRSNNYIRKTGKIRVDQDEYQVNETVSFQCKPESEIVPNDFHLSCIQFLKKQSRHVKNLPQNVKSTIVKSQKPGLGKLISCYLDSFKYTPSTENSIS